MEAIKVRISLEVIGQQAGGFCSVFWYLFLHTLNSTMPVPIFTHVIL